MTRRYTAILIAAAAAATTIAWAQHVRPRAADEYRLELKQPPGCAAYAGSATPHRFGGELLAIWEKSTPAGKGIMYVVGVRRQGNFVVEQIADSFEQFLAGAKIDGERFENFTVMGRPAMKFALRGPGTGQTIAALSGEGGTTVATYMEVVLTTNQWTDGSGTDFIQFVMACPEPSRDAVGEAFRTLVHGTTLRGQYDPTSGGNNGAGAPPTPEKEEPVATPEPAGNTSLPTNAVAAAAAPSQNPGPTNSPAPAGVVFGSLYIGSGSVPTQVAIQLLRSEQRGSLVRWAAPAENKTDLYICVWPALRATWVVPGEDFRKMARKTADGYELSFSDALAPYLGNWDALLAVPRTN